MFAYILLLTTPALGEEPVPTADVATDLTEGKAEKADEGKAEKADEGKAEKADEGKAEKADEGKADEGKAETAPEVTVPASESAAIQQGQESFNAFTAGSWGVGIVLALGVALFLYNKFFAKKKAA